MAEMRREREGDPSVHHVYPTAGRGHVTDGPGCWCGPDLYRVCTQCDGDDAGCWACDEGLARVDAARPGDRLLVVHHRIEDDEPIETVGDVGLE